MGENNFATWPMPLYGVVCDRRHCVVDPPDRRIERALEDNAHD